MNNDYDPLAIEAIEETEELVSQELAKAEDVLIARFGVARDELKEFVVNGLKNEILDEDVDIAQYLLCVSVTDEYRKIN